MKRTSLLCLPLLLLSACGFVPAPPPLPGQVVRFTSAAVQACGSVGWHLQVNRPPQSTEPLPALVYELTQSPVSTEGARSSVPDTTITRADDYLFMAYDPNFPGSSIDRPLVGYVNTFTCTATGQTVTTGESSGSTSGGPLFTVSHQGTLTVTRNN